MKKQELRESIGMLIHQFHEQADELAEKMEAGEIPTVFFENKELDKNNSTLFVLGHAFALRQAAILMQSVLDEDSKTKETGK